MAQFKRELLKVCVKGGLSCVIRLRRWLLASFFTSVSTQSIHAIQDFEYLPPSIATSAADGTGKGQLLHFIGSLRVAVESQGSRKN